jgi:threonine synthase
MDIQVSSNFERLLFEAEERDGGAVRRLMAGLGQSGAFTLSTTARQNLAPHFASGACDETETARTIANMLDRTGLIVDPHTAVGIAVAERHLGGAPMLTLATAHPAKFPGAIEAACGKRPALPDWARPILSREERYEVLPAELAPVENAIEARTRAARVAG